MLNCPNQLQSMLRSDVCRRSKSLPTLAFVASHFGVHLVYMRRFNESGDLGWHVVISAPLTSSLKELDDLVLGHRLPYVIDFNSDMM